MTTNQLKELIQAKLNANVPEEYNGLNTHERVILSTYLNNPVHEVAFKLRISIHEVDRVITNFIKRNTIPTPTN